MIEVSIIIATLNGEKDLPRLFDSIMKQDFDKPYEVLLVNGPSTDKTKEVALSYVTKVKDLRVIDFRFKHTLMARNEGVKEARGKYITFLDSDDYIAPNYVSKLYETMLKTDADIVQAGIMYDYDGKHVLEPLRMNKTLDNTGFLGGLMNDLTIHGFMWNKLYKKELFGYINNFYDKNIARDDLLYMFLLGIRVRKFVSIKDPLYYYVKTKNSGSITNKKNKFRIEFMFILFFIEKAICYENGDKELIKKFHQARLGRYLHYFYEFHFENACESKEEKHELHKKLKGHLKLLNKKEELKFKDSPYKDYAYLLN